MSYLVTGGAGFIGSCIVRTLNDAGIDDIIVVDHISQTNKWLNLRNKRYSDYIQKQILFERLSGLDNIEAVIHMGACSSTTENDFDYLWNNNFEFSKMLWLYCAEKQIPFIYASSAATYGNGQEGFDDCNNIDQLRPLNAYGYSKQLFDLWIKYKADVCPSQYVGLKFFNVYGPNEYFKGSMASMVYHGYRQICDNGSIKLFRSYDSNYADGLQLRDFIYVKDICEVVFWLLQHPQVSGLFNLGTGHAQSFLELAEATFHALGKEPNIEYIDMPEQLQGRYQYFTQAEMKKLRNAGYKAPFRSVEEGVADYVGNYLSKGYEIY